MWTVGQIVRERREALGLTLAAVAEKIGATKAYISMIENHRVANPPSRHLLEELERALRIGDGALLHAADWENTPAPFRAEFEQITEHRRQIEEFMQLVRSATKKGRRRGISLDKLCKSGKLGRLANRILDGTQGINMLVPSRYKVPLINSLVAGYPTAFTDLDRPTSEAVDYVDCPDVRDPQAFAARVVGDLMLPEYKKGDVIVFSPEADIDDGDDCFVRLESDHESTFKRVFFESRRRKIRLQPLNPKFPPHTVESKRVTGMYKAVTHIKTIA